jgi:hypothetical protein
MQGRIIGVWKDIAENTFMRVCVDDKVHLMFIKPRGEQEYSLSASRLQVCDGSCNNFHKLPADAEEAVRQFLASKTPAAASAGS